MPIYEYQCLACNHELEVMQKISDKPLQECPACGESTLKKKVSAAAFRLKGGGWYETDFKTGDKKKNIAGESSTAKPAPASTGKDSGGDSGSSKSSTGNSGSGKSNTSSSSTSA